MSSILKPVESKTKHLDYFLSQCHRRKYPSKSTIIYAGDKSDSLFYIIKGSVTVIIEDDDGREMIMAYLNTGDFLVRWASLITWTHEVHGLKPNLSVKSLK